MKTITARILHIDYGSFEKRLLWSLFGTVLVLGVLYSLFVSMSVTNIVMRKELGTQIMDIEETLTGLESAYLARKNDIQKKYAYSLGFVDVTKKSYVTRAPLFERLTVNE